LQFLPLMFMVSHKNKDILDNTTASYTLEEQKKLADLNLSDYVTIRKLNDEILMVHESITPIRLASHSHQNKELLDSLDADSLALLPDLQQFEDTIKEDIHRIDEITQSINNTAHTHENLDILDGITADKIKKWDSISTLQTQLNGLSTELTVWKNKCSSNSDRLHANEATIDNIISELDEIQEKINAVPSFDAVQETLKAMQAEIDSLGGNIQTMGISYPPAMLKALEVLQKKAGKTDEDAQQNLEELEEKETLQNPEEEESEEDGS